jgi:hypothetical protein
MLSEIRQKTTVQPGGVIEIHSPELPDGAEVEVIVWIDRTSEAPSSLVDLIGAAKGSFSTPTEADEFIRGFCSHS